MDRGTRILDRFEIEAAVGRGGAGSVYRARDLSTGGLVALKILRSDEPRDAARFASESMLLKMLDDPAIVRYVAQGKTSEGDPFLALEWLEGGSLKDRLAEGALSVVDSLTIATRVCHALLTLERRRVVHRDIKPANIVIVNGVPQRTKLFDFGIARFLETQDVSEEGTLLGTPGYLAPEQVRGELSVDTRADLFALGAVLYECLTGVPAFQDDDSIALLLKVVLEDPVPPSEVSPLVPPEVDRLVAMLLEKQREKRPADAATALGMLVSISEKLEGARHSQPAPPRVSIGPAETRVVSVVLAQPTDPTRKAVVASARNALSALGVELCELVDGSVYAFAPDRGADRMAASARAALMLSRVLGEGSRVALASGRALFDGRIELSDVIERAARQLRRSNAEGVVVDDVTLGMLGAQFEAFRRETSEGDVELVLAGARGTMSGEKTLLGMRSLYLGRDQELEALVGFFEESLASARPSLVWVTGEPGYGKSRLGDEFAERIRARPRLRLHRARAPSFGAAPLSLLGDMLREALGLADVDDTREAHDRLLAAGAGAKTRDPVRTAAFLGEIAGFPFPSTASPALALSKRDTRVFGDQLVRAFEEWILGECELGPVVLLLDDVHLADAASLGVLSRVRATLARHVFILALGVGTADNDVVDSVSITASSGPTELSLGEIDHVIHLDALESAAARRIVETTAARDLPASVVSEIVERAAGNAFYLEELVRSRDRVAQSDGKPIPSKLVLATVEDRLLALDADARRFLRAASILGDPFDLAAVAELMGVDLRLVETLARTLDEAEIVRRTTPRTMTFRHSLLAEAAGAMLTDSDRMLGHSLAARWMTRQERANPLAIAEHYLLADARDEALIHFHAAAKRALESNDFDGVVRTNARIGEFAQGRLRGEIQLIVAEAQRWKGNHTEALRAATDALSVLSPGADSWYAALGEWALAAGRLGKLDDLARAVAELREAQHVDLRPEVRRSVRISSALASLHLMTSGQSKLANELLEDLFRDTSLDDIGVTARIHQTAGFRALLSGDLGGYLEHMKEAVAAFEASGDTREACLQGVNLGNAALQLGAYENAEAALEASRAAAGGLGLRHVVAYAEHNLGIVFLHLGRADEAKRVEALAINAFIASGDKRMEGAARIYAAMIDLAMGKFVDAELQGVRGVMLLSDTPPAKACALATLAAAELAQGTEATRALAETHSAEAYAILLELGGIEEGEALVRLIRAEVLFARGDVEAGRAVAEEAAKRLEERATRVTDPSVRAAFLRRVPENRRTIELAQRSSAAV